MEYSTDGAEEVLFIALSAYCQETSIQDRSCYWCNRTKLSNVKAFQDISQATQCEPLAVVITYQQVLLAKHLTTLSSCPLEAASPPVGLIG
jgi:hypothetical protein